MKSLIAALVLALTLIAAPAIGEYLICDPQDGVIAYDIEVNGAIVAEDYSAESDGSIKFDVSYFTPGQYIFSIRAIGQGGWPGPWSDPYHVSKPGTAGSLRISK